jgi:hypothetical protein
MDVVDAPVELDKPDIFVQDAEVSQTIEVITSISAKTV